MTVRKEADSPHGNTEVHHGVSLIGALGVCYLQTLAPGGRERKVADALRECFETQKQIKRKGKGLIFRVRGRERTNGIVLE